ncbi:MAG: GNAT family N-acetyltransferase [Anaerolineae bacterium]|jgi:GNAT superfamily N-acetyltransferase|nr:GNAT family N-acetyltransferase [Chloroflexota bacterium]
MARIEIRRALPTAHDAAAFARVERTTLGDSDLSPQEMLLVLRRAEQYVYLAMADDRAVGVLATCETGAQGGIRLELDMLGVLTAWRNMGIAGSLVAAALHDGRSRGCTSFRAVVAADNLASQKVMARAGLETSASGQSLLTQVFADDPASLQLPRGWTVRLVADLAQSAPENRDWALPGHWGLYLSDESGREVAAAALLPVQTMACASCWIEKLVVRDPEAGQILFRAAAVAAQRRGRDEIGVLLPRDSAPEAAALAAGYQSGGVYHILMGS